MIEKLEKWAKERGYCIALGPKTVVESVRREIRNRRTAAELDGAFFEHDLESITRGEADDFDRTIIVIAKPRPAHVVGFDLGGEIFDALLPPTYFRYRATFEDVRQDLTANGLPGAQIEYAAVPLKGVASRLGLVRYGRNNICYAPGMGSYLQLYAYETDAHIPQPDRTDVNATSLLAECENCGICQSICPTDCIREDRILLEAERCLTFLNENPGDWPDWIHPSSHNCLLGCLECQRCCPANPELPIERSSLCFSAAETRLLLSTNAPADNRAETAIRTKLAWLGQPYAEPVFGRNLRALINKRSGLADKSGL